MGFCCWSILIVLGATEIAHPSVRVGVAAPAPASRGVSHLAPGPFLLHMARQAQHSGDSHHSRAQARKGGGPRKWSRKVMKGGGGVRETESG